MRDSKNSKKNKPYKSHFIKDKQSKNFDKEKFIVNKYSKLQKTAEKSGSKTNKNRLKKKKVYITILGQNSEKNEKFLTFPQNFVKKKKKIVNPMLNVMEPMTKIKKFRKNLLIIQKKMKFQKLLKHQ